MGAQLRAPVLLPSVDRRTPASQARPGGRRPWSRARHPKRAAVSCSRLLGRALPGVAKEYKQCQRHPESDESPQDFARRFPWGCWFRQRVSWSAPIRFELGHENVGEIGDYDADQFNESTIYRLPKCIDKDRSSDDNHERLELRSHLDCSAARAA